MVGDAAAISGQPLGEVGLHIGKLFAAMRDGQSAGEALARLQELGLISGAAKRQFEDLAKAQKKGEQANLTSAQALNVLQQVLKKTNGAMDELSKTTEGKISNMKDNFAQLQVAFGTGMNEGLKSALDAANNFLPQLQERFSKAGNTLGIAIKDAVEGNTELLTVIGGLLGEIVMAGFKSVYMKVMDETITGTQNIASDLLNLNKSFLKSVATGDITGHMQTIADIGRNRQQSSSLSDWMATQSDQVSQGPSAQKINQIMTQKAIAEGVKTGINESMSTEVRQGIIEAWGWERRNSGAKFSN
jgi:hypothetical protein